jgi:hypothetical protein
MTDIDQGVLDYLNLVTPRCSVNQEYARVMKQTGIAKSVPLGQQCPSGYTAYQPTKEGFPANTINQICTINTPTNEQNAAVFPLAMQWSACVTRRPAAPAPPLVCEYCKCPPGSGRVDLGCPPQNMACMGCPVAFTPGIPIVPPTAPVAVMSPAPAPVTKSELPMWAIILIVIAVFMLVGGLTFMGIKMSQ